MLIYQNYKAKKGKDYIKLTADYYVDFEHIGEETFSIGTPKCWDETLFGNVNIDEKDIYYICSATIPEGKYNRITDYKKVWGLNQIRPGIYNNSYLNKSGKVYFGIAKGSNEDFMSSNIASTIILIPRGQPISCEKIYNIFAQKQYDFILKNDCDILFDILKAYPESITFQYCSKGEISLTIFAHNADCYFDDKQMKKWKPDCGSVYRWD